MFRDEDAGRYLFHYTTAETFLAHIVPTRKLRMSPLNQVNDPKEATDWTCGVTIDGPDFSDGRKGVEEFRELQRNFNNALKARTRVLCFTRDDVQLASVPLLQKYHRGYSHSRMWDQYAGNHTGVCLVFERNALSGEIAGAVAGLGDLRHRDVSYGDPPTAIDEMGDYSDAFSIGTRALAELGLDRALRDHQVRHHHFLYFHKSLDWASEQETRWVLLADEDAPYIYVPVERSLSGVVFGPDYSRDSIPMVQSVLGTDVIYGQLHWQNGLPIMTPA
jgi:hypothetical protein